MSIITVCRNDLQGLKNTFESICAQDYDDIEWIVVDGKSVDGTAEWLKDHHRLQGTWLSEPDNGIYDAMNKGIRLATGRYILFMNSRDGLAQSDVVSNLAHRIKSEKTAPDFIYGDSLDLDEQGKIYYRKAMHLSYLKFGMPTRHQAMLYRRDILVQEYYPLDFKLSGDYALTSIILMKNIKSLKVDFPICLFHSGGVHDLHRVRALFEDFRIRREIMNENRFSCVILFCMHWLHYYIRILFPALNKILIYRSGRL